MGRRAGVVTWNLTSRGRNFPVGGREGLEVRGKGWCHSAARPGARACAKIDGAADAVHLWWDVFAAISLPPLVFAAPRARFAASIGAVESEREGSSREERGERATQVRVEGKE